MSDDYRPLEPGTVITPTDKAHHVLEAPVITDISPTEETALALYDGGFNVLIMPYWEKKGFPWKEQQYTRLNRNDPLYGLSALIRKMHGLCNLAVMAGRTSMNLFVLDCETEAVFDYHMRQAQARKLPIWAVSSGRGGHLWFLCTEGEVENISPGVMPDCELRGRGYTLVPASIHPSGRSYQWVKREGSLPPEVECSQIDWLADKDGVLIEVATRKHWTPTAVDPNPLLKTTQDYLTNGHAIPEGSREISLFKAACDYAACGRSRADAQRDLAPMAAASGLSAGEIEHAITGAYSQPRISVKQTPPIPRWQLAAAFADHHEWAGRTGQTQRAVFMALVECAKANNKGVFRGSVREVAQKAHVSVNTARKYLDELSSGDTSLIVFSGTDHMSGANLWRFSYFVIRQGRKWLQKELSIFDTPIPDSYSGSCVSVLLNSDVVERGALGHTGLCIYRALLSLKGGGTRREIAAAADVSVWQVGHALEKLKAANLVIHVRHGLWQAVSVSTEQLEAKFPQKRGAGKRREQGFKRERALKAGRRVAVAIEQHLRYEQESQRKRSRERSARMG